MAKLILGIAILALVAAGFFFAGRYLSSRFASLNRPIRLLILGVLLLLAALAPIEFSTPWSFSNVALANSSYPISVVAYLCVIVALWGEAKARSTPAVVRSASGGVALSLFAITVAALASPVALFLIVAWSLQPPPVASGQISPRLTYVLDQRQDWGGGYTVEYRIYHQSSLLPVHRLVARGDACPASPTGLLGYKLQPGPTPQTVTLSCRFPDSTGAMRTVTSSIPLN